MVMHPSLCQRAFGQGFCVPKSYLKGKFPPCGSRASTKNRGPQPQALPAIVPNFPRECLGQSSPLHLLSKGS
eukprot:3169459-Karenia_brevis.AAC.1